jgi:hypothetical protein
MNTTDSKILITEEVEKLIDQQQKALGRFKKIAVAEAWKLLQSITASIIQIIEAIGKDLEGSEKKSLAMNFVSQFYDRVFIVIDIPYIPNFIQAYMHRYIKGFLMILVSSTIDSMVTIFRNTGIFLKKNTEVKDELYTEF